MTLASLLSCRTCRQNTILVTLASLNCVLNINLSDTSVTYLYLYEAIVHFCNRSIICTSYISDTDRLRPIQMMKISFKATHILIHTTHKKKKKKKNKQLISKIRSFHFPTVRIKQSSFLPCAVKQKFTSGNHSFCQWINKVV